MGEFWFNRPFKGETAWLDSSDNEMKCLCLRDAFVYPKNKKYSSEEMLQILSKDFIQKWKLVAVNMIFSISYLIFKN